MQKKINIVHLIPALGVGGAEKVVLNFCKKINKEKYNLIIAYWGNREELLEPIKNTGVGVIKLRLRKVISINTILRVSKLLKKVSAHLLHTYFIDADIIGFLASKISKVPMIINIHSYPFPVKKNHCFRYRLMSLGVNRILCVSNTVKNHLVSYVGINPEKISVVYNGIDLKELSGEKTEGEKKQIRKTLGIKEGCQIIGNISRLISDKGHKYLLLSIPHVLKIYPNTIFLIIGDGELKTELINLSKTLNIMDRVIFAGTRNDIPDLLSIMDIFVFPTFHEAMGISVLEAMAMGKPIIATDDAAVPEIIQNGKEGFLVHPGDPNALSEAILRLLDDQKSTQEMGRLAKERVKIFSDEAMARQIEKIYTEILQ